MSIKTLLFTESNKVYMPNKIEIRQTKTGFIALCALISSFSLLSRLAVGVLWVVIEPYIISVLLQGTSCFVTGFH